MNANSCDVQQYGSIWEHVQHVRDSQIKEMESSRGLRVKHYWVLTGRDANGALQAHNQHGCLQYLPG